MQKAVIILIDKINKRTIPTINDKYSSNIITNNPSKHLLFHEK
jgi:hypothetical protein